MTTSSKSTDRLPLRSARVIQGDPYQVLVLEIGDRTARLIPEWHPSLRTLGLVWIGEQFADVLPDRTYTDPASGGVTELVGYTDDPRIVDLMSRFFDGRLPVGPIPV